MQISLDKFRAKLVVKILYARSPEHADRFINAAITAMKRKKVNGYIITRFIDKVHDQLSKQSMIVKDGMQRSNMLAARCTLLNTKKLMNLELA